MSREVVQEMIERWISEPAFKDELRANPLETVAKYGYKLDATELETLQNLDLTLSDEELQSRVSPASCSSSGSSS